MITWSTEDKPQVHWTPPFFPLPSGCKIQHGHSRYEPKWCKFLKLVIYLTFDVLAFHCWSWLASSNQRKYKQHQISDLQSLLASSSLLSLKRVLCHCIASNFLHRFSWRFWRIDANRLKIVLMLTERLQDVFVWPSENRRSGASDHQKKSTEKKWVLLDPVLTARWRLCGVRWRLCVSDFSSSFSFLTRYLS